MNRNENLYPKSTRNLCRFKTFQQNPGGQSHLEPQPAQPASQTRLLFLILALTASLMGALLALLPAAGHDQLWFLMMARRSPAGTPLYGPEIFDSNPPAIVWASTLPVSLGNLLHIPATLPAKLLVLLAETAVASLCLPLLRRHRPGLSSTAAAGLLFVYIVLTVVLPARDFGQRDQLLSFLVLPYILAASLDPAIHRLTAIRSIAGVLAAIGLCVKPQYALIPLVLELALLTAFPARSRLRRLFRPEPLILCLTGAAYLAAIRQFTPLYFTQALPILRQTYWAVGHLSLPQLALEAIELLLLGLAAITLYLVQVRKDCHIDRSELPYRSRSGETCCLPAEPPPTAQALPATLLIAAAAALIAYAIQGTGWYYQQLPALVLFGSALAIQLLDLPQPRIPAWLPALLLRGTTALCVLAVALTTHFMDYPFTPNRAFAINEPDPSFFTTLAPDTPVAMLTTSVDDAMMPIERYHLTWAQRTNNLWLLPAILRDESNTAGRYQPTPTQLTALAATQRLWMAEDLQRWRPQLVLVQRCQSPEVHCQLLEDRHDDLLAWFLRDPAFAALWTRYRFDRRSGPFDAYVLGTTR